MTLYGIPQPLVEATENMGMEETVTHTPANTRRIDQGETATTDPKSTNVERSTIAQYMPPVFQATHYGEPFQHQWMRSQQQLAI